MYIQAEITIPLEYQGHSTDVGTIGKHMKALKVESVHDTIGLRVTTLFPDKEATVTAIPDETLTAVHAATSGFKYTFYHLGERQISFEFIACDDSYSK